MGWYIQNNTQHPTTNTSRNERLLLLSSNSPPTLLDSPNEPQPRLLVLSPTARIDAHAGRGAEHRREDAKVMLGLGSHLVVGRFLLPIAAVLLVMVATTTTTTAIQKRRPLLLLLLPRSREQGVGRADAELLVDAAKDAEVRFVAVFKLLALQSKTYNISNDRHGSCQRKK